MDTDRRGGLEACFAAEKDSYVVPQFSELEEAPHVLTNIIGCSPEQVKCEMPVEVVWEEVTDEITLPKFRPAPENVS